MTSDEKARLQLDDLRRVLARWAEVLPDVAHDDRARDSAILRFELAYEVAWRLASTLSQAQGLMAESPRGAFANAFRLGWTSDEGVWADIINARNEAVHVYHEDLARRLAGQLPTYFAAFSELAAAASDAIALEKP